MKKILILYATRTGSTAEIAAGIAEMLHGAGASVDVLPIESAHDVKDYDAVVVGSAIRMGQWLPEAIEFVKANCETLRHIPTAYFLVSGLLHEDTLEMRQKVLAFLNPVRAIVEPVSVGMLAGKMDYSKLSWPDRFIAKAVTPEGDWRNWDAIRGWAQELQTSLVHP